MDYYYPMEEVHQHPGGLRPLQLPWHWQWRLFALLSSPMALQHQQPRRAANHVSWEETAAAHLFSASLPGNKTCCAPLLMRPAFFSSPGWFSA